MALNVDINSKLEGQALQELRNHLKDVVTDMNRLRASGDKQGEQFKQLQLRAFDVVNAIKGVTRENKGLSAEIEKTPLQKLNADLTASKNALLQLIQAKQQGTPAWKKEEDHYRTLISQHALLYKTTTGLREAVGGSLSINTIYSNILAKIGQSAAQATGGIGQFFNISTVFNNAVTNMSTSTVAAATGFEGVGAAVTGKMNPALIAGGIAIGALVVGVFGAIKGIQAFIDLIKFVKPGAEFNVLNNCFIEMSGGIEQSKQSLDLFQKALVGNLDNRKIEAFANSFRLLGESDDEIAKFFDIAETRTEQFDGNIELAINSLQRFVETGNKKGGLQLKFDVTLLEKEMAKLGNTTVDNLKKFSDEDQQILRKQAIYKLYGKSIDEINKKKKDEADSIQALFTLYENIKLSVQSFMSTALKPLVGFINQVVDYLKDMELGLDSLNEKFPELQRSLEYIGKVFKRFGEDAFNSVKVFIDANLTLLNAIGTATGYVVSTVISGIVAIAQGIKSVVDLTNKFGGVVGITVDGSGIDAIINNLKKLQESSATGSPSRGTGKIKDSHDITPPKNDKDKSGKTDKEKEEEILNLIELKNKELEKANLKLQANLGSVGAERDIRAEILAIEKEIYRLRTGIDNSSKFKMRTGEELLKEDLLKIKPNLRAGKPTNERIASDKDYWAESGFDEDKLLNSMSDNFQGMVNSTVSMLQNLNLMETGFGQILNGVVQVINIFKSAFDTGSSIFGFIGDIISLIPGGGLIGKAISAIPGRATGGSVSSNSPYFVGEKGIELFVPSSNGSVLSNSALLQMISSQSLFENTNKMASSGMGGTNMQPNITVIVESEVEKTKAQRFYMNTYPEYASRQNKRKLSQN